MRSKNSLIPILLVLTVMLMLVHAALPVQALRDRKALLAVADSFVSQEQPDGNFGRAFDLHIAGYVYSEYVSFLMFNLGDLPRDSVIEEATLRLYNAGDVDSAPPTMIRVSVHYCPSNDWTEDGITYNNMPTFTPEPIDTVNITSGLAWYEWDVTGQALSVFDQAIKRLSLALETADSIGDTFYSRTSLNVDKRPELSVLYSYTPSSGVDPVFVGLIVAIAGIAVVTGLFFVRRIRKSGPNPPLKKFEQKPTRVVPLELLTLRIRKKFST